MIAMLRRRFQVPFSCFRSPAPQRGRSIAAIRRKTTGTLYAFAVALTILFLPAIAAAQQPPEHTPFHALAFYTTKGEQDHIDFALQALRFYGDLAKKNNFSLASTTDWNDMSTDKLKDIQLVIWLNDFPHKPEQRKVFEDYMAHGGAWLGFHVAAYNDDSTNWPWFVDFLGGSVFFGNNWPPLPAKLIVDDRAHPITQNLPATFNAPANEWYIWKPSPRLNKDVKVLLTLDPQNYPIGLKDTITGGDCPVVWTNTRFHMLYLNMGHGDKIFTDATQNKLLENAIVWLGTNKSSLR
jgi:type 1 glutamine amidotransferase